MEQNQINNQAPVALEWKDISSYSQRDVEREINSVVATAGVFQIGVHRHRDHPGKWVISCDPFCTARPLKASDLDAAKQEAQSLIRKNLELALVKLK